MNALRAAFAYFSILPVGLAVRRREPVRWRRCRSSALVLGALAGRSAGSRVWPCPRRSPSRLRSRRASCSAGRSTSTVSSTRATHCSRALPASAPLRDSQGSAPRYVRARRVGDRRAVWLGRARLIPPAEWPWSLAFCAGAARAAAVLNAYAFRTRTAARRRAPSRTGRTASRRTRHPGRAACLLDAPVVRAASVPAFAASLLLGSWCASRLDGVLVGDCYGAIVVVLDVALLASVASGCGRRLRGKAHRPAFDEDVEEHEFAVAIGDDRPREDVALARSRAEFGQAIRLVRAFRSLRQRRSVRANARDRAPSARSLRWRVLRRLPRDETAIDLQAADRKERK